MGILVANRSVVTEITGHTLRDSMQNGVSQFAKEHTQVYLCIIMKWNEILFLAKYQTGTF